MCTLLHNTHMPVEQDFQNIDGYNFKQCTNNTDSTYCSAACAKSYMAWSFYNCKNIQSLLSAVVLRAANASFHSLENAISELYCSWTVEYYGRFGSSWPNCEYFITCQQFLF